jgi:hypothetical protein
MYNNSCGLDLEIGDVKVGVSSWGVNCIFLKIILVLQVVELHVPSVSILLAIMSLIQLTAALL